MAEKHRLQKKQETWHKLKKRRTDVVVLQKLQATLRYLDAAMRQRHQAEATVGVATDFDRSLRGKSLEKANLAAQRIVLEIENLGGEAEIVRSWEDVAQMRMLSIEVAIDMLHIRIPSAQKRWREIDAELKSIDQVYRRKRNEKPIGDLYL